jgi:hypothetical protein
MGRGITIRIDRAQAIRIVGEAMRLKTQQFERDKKAYPIQLAKAKKIVLAKLKSLQAEVSNGCTSERLDKIVSEDLIAWQRRRDIIPSHPELNICTEKGLLLMLQQDVRKIIPINSNHELWAILQGKCEVIRG